MRQVALLSVAVLLVAGCSAGQQQGSVSSTSTPSSDPVAADLTDLSAELDEAATFIERGFDKGNLAPSVQPYAYLNPLAANGVDPLFVKYTGATWDSENETYCVDGLTSTSEGPVWFHRSDLVPNVTQGHCGHPETS